MIILRNEVITEETGKPYFIVIETDDHFEVSRRNVDNTSTYTIVKSDIPLDGRFVYYWSHYGFGLVCAKDYDDARDTTAFFSKYGCPEGALITVARAGSGTVIVVASPTLTPTSEFVIRNLHAPSIQLISEFLPGFENTPRAIKSKAKMELMRNVNPLDSLAALEKQVDILTQLVISLSLKQPEDERPEWLNALEVAYGSASCLDGDMQANISSMVSYKRYIRALQTQYKNAQIK